MKRSFLALSMLFALPFSAQIDAAPHPRPAKDHPLLGTWHYAVPGTNCVAAYTFLPDGVRRYSTGTQAGSSVFTVSDAPMEGFYTLHDVVTETNGGTSCSGSPATPPGDASTAYVRFRTVREMWLCFEMSEAECIGPFVRATGR